MATAARAVHAAPPAVQLGQPIDNHQLMNIAMSAPMDPAWLEDPDCVLASAPDPRDTFSEQPLAQDDSSLSVESVIGTIDRIR